MLNEKARAHIRLILPFWSQNFPLWFGQKKTWKLFAVWNRINSHTSRWLWTRRPLITGEPTIPHHNILCHTKPTILWQLTCPTTPMPHNATQCHALPRHAISHCTKIKVPLPPCFFSQEEFLSCRLFYVPPLDLFPSKISFFACVICCFFWWTTLKYPFIYY